MTITYPYLPEGRKINYVPADNPFMREAQKVRNEESTESRHPTGAVIVKNGIVIGKGANQSKIRNPQSLKLHSKYCIRRMLGVPTGTKYWLCPGCATHHQHAESRATADVKKRGVDARGADLYLYGHWWACEPCWNAMIDAGIANVYLLEGSEELFNKK
jgi:deoxycytidylate deaminase